MANRNRFGKSVRWQRRHYEGEKESIRLELAAKAAQSPRRAVLASILEQVNSLGEDGDSTQQLRRFLLIIFALTHQMNYGGLKEREIHRLSDLAIAILQTEGIQPGSSRLAHAYSELHVVLSQIYRKEGRQWQAAWELQLGYQFSGSLLPGGQAFQELAFANRSLRLGFGPRALSQFLAAENNNPDPATFERARLGRILALRLSGQFDLAEEIAVQSMADARIGARFQQELTWERACQQAQRQGHLDDLLPLVQKDGTHHQDSYLLEATLWAKAPARRHWLSAVPSTRSLHRRSEFQAQRFGFLYRACQQLDDCYDFAVPLPVRIRQLGAILRRVRQLVSVGPELLVLAASARWLHRARAEQLARLVLDEYAGLCLRLSGGATMDVLNLMGDMPFSNRWIELESTPTP